MSSSVCETLFGCFSNFVKEFLSRIFIAYSKHFLQFSLVLLRSRKIIELLYKFIKELLCYYFYSMYYFSVYLLL